MSRMAAAAGPSSQSSPAASASHSPASSRTKAKAKMLDKFGSLGKKVVKEVLGGTGNNPAQNRGDLIPTFGRGGAARPKVRVYGATPMPQPATKSLGAMGSYDSPPGHPSASVPVQVDTVISAGNNNNTASSGLVPTTSSPHLLPTHLTHPNPTGSITTTSSTDTSFRFADPPLSDDVPGSAAEASARPHSDHPFVLAAASAGSTARGALPNLGEGAGRLDDPYHLENEQNPLLLLGERERSASLLLPSSTSCLLSHRTRSALQSQDDFISMFPTHHHHQSRSPSPRQRSLSPPPPRGVPPLPLETKPKVRSSSNPPPFLIRDDFEFLNFPPDQQQQLGSSSQLSQLGEPGGSGSGGSASRRSSRRLGRRISVATSNITYTTARSKSRPRTAFTTTTTTRSFNRRAPPLHLQLDPNQVFYPRPQLPEQRAYGSGLLDRDEEESVVLRYDTPAGVVSEWRGDEDGAREGQPQRRAGESKNAYRLSSPMEFPPTPSSGSFDLGSGGGSNTALGRSRTVTPGGMTLATTTSEAELDDRGRSRLRGPRRPVSVAGSVQETFGAGSRSAVVSNLPAPSERDPLPELQPAEEGDGQRRRRPLPSVPVPQYASLPHPNLQQTANSSSGSLPSLSLPIHQPPLHRQHQLSSSASHASTHSRSSLGGLSETQSQSDAASSSIASANALLIQNALKLLAGGAPTAPPPVPPPVAVPPLQPVQQLPPMATLPTAAVPPASVLGLGLPISPFLLPQAQPPQLAYGPMSPLMGGLGAGMSLPSIPGLPMQPIPPTLPQQQLFSPQLGAGMMPTLPLSPPMQQTLPLGVPGLGAPPTMGGQYPQALELLIALANQNLRLMAAVEQQRLEQQLQQLQLQNVSGAVGTGGMDLRRERSAPPAPSTPNPDEGLGLQTSSEHLEPSASSSSSRTDRRRTRTSLLSTSTAPSNFTATASNSSSSNSSQSKRASGAHSQQTPTPPVSPRPSSASGFPTTPSSPAVSTRPPSFKARISTPKLGRPFRISLSTVLGREGGEGSSTRGLATPVEEVPPPVPPLPAALVGSAARSQPSAHAGSFIDTRPSTALSDYEADDDEERKRERPHSWLAEVRGWEELVLGDLAEEAEGQDVSSSASAARAMAGMGELKSPGLFSVSTSTTAAESSMSGSTRKNTFDEERASGEVFGKVPFPRSRSRPRELGFASAGYAMKMGNRGRTLSSISRVGPEMFERDARVRDSIDSMDSVDSTASSNGGAMDLEELSIMTAHVF
ncbi:hypothetical protein FRC00_004323, partial [Tulasnella sp. 408]